MSKRINNPSQAILDVALPESPWTPPAQLPDRLEGLVGIDVETEDRGLGAGSGPGWAWRGGGRLAGIGVSADNFRGYLPIAHEGGGNMDSRIVLRWLNDVLADETQPKVGANLLYDLGWLKRAGVEVRGPLHDVLWAEALLDEHRRSYSLNDVGFDRTGYRKDEALLREAAAAWGIDPKADLWRLPAKYVGRYGEIDAELPRRVLAVQAPLIEEQGLQGVYDMERRLIHLYLDMRWRGVRLDTDRAERLVREYQGARDRALREIQKITGVRVDPWIAQDVARALAHDGVVCPRTPSTDQPSVTKDFLERLDTKVSRLVVEARGADKLVGTFLKGQLLGHEKDGRIHAEFHPLRSDDGGTIGGRGSMSRPNLQFIPKRTELGREIRKCFLPEEGETWHCADYSQQEPRLLVHWAAATRPRGRPMPGADAAVAKYHEDPTISYHNLVVEMTGLGYAQAKALNLAITYGRGIKSTSEELGLSVEETRDLFDRHREALPFASALARVAQRQGDRTGQIRTISGRLCRFPMWEPARGFTGTPLPKDQAREKWPGQRLRRAWTQKALNRLIQGSAADQTKKAMLDVYEAGLGRHVLIQVHDELDLSAADPGVAQEIARIMEAAVQLKIPSRVEVDSGPNWGDAA